ncbi:MAG: hypothetical protein ACK4NF_04040 [Planctomycetota bacterium]
MRLKNFLFTFNWIIVVIISTFGILVFLNAIKTDFVWNALSRIKSYTPLGPYIVLTFFSSLIILNMVYLIVKIFFRKYASTIKVNEGNSEVCYEIDCLEDTITSNILKLPEIADTWVSIKVPRKNINNVPAQIDVGFSLYEGYSGKTAAQKIKDIVELTLKHLIDYDKDVQFKIRLNKIVSKNLSKKGGKTGHPPPLFRGPVYPVEEEYEE